MIVFAASSLTDAYGDLADAFAEATGAERPDLAFAGSQILKLQLSEGAKADLFASANSAHLDSLVASGHVSEPRVFAQNDLVVIVPRSNPASIRRFADLKDARRIVVGAPEVPIGGYTAQLFEGTASSFGPDFVRQVRANIVSEESNVRLVRAKVELGEADAAIVYRTDVSPNVRVIEVPPELAVKASYYIGFVGAQPRGAAKRWTEFLDSPEGRAILSEHGFTAP